MDGPSHPNRHTWRAPSPSGDVAPIGHDRAGNGEDARPPEQDQQRLQQAESERPTITIDGQTLRVERTVDDLGQALYLSLQHQQWQAAAAFLDEGRWTTRQIRFTRMLVDDLVRNGVVDPGRLYEDPYLALGGVDAVYPQDAADAVVAVLAEVRARAEVEAGKVA